MDAAGRRPKPEPIAGRGWRAWLWPFSGREVSPEQLLIEPVGQRVPLRDIERADVASVVIEDLCWRRAIAAGLARRPTVWRRRARSAWRADGAALQNKQARSRRTAAEIGLRAEQIRPVREQAQMSPTHDGAGRRQSHKPLGSMCAARSSPRCPRHLSVTGVRIPVQRGAAGHSARFQEPPVCDAQPSDGRSRAAPSRRPDVRVQPGGSGPRRCHRARQAARAGPAAATRHATRGCAAKRSS
jgi:hypothetical protein